MFVRLPSIEAEGHTEDECESIGEGVTKRVAIKEGVNVGEADDFSLGDVVASAEIVGGGLKEVQLETSGVVVGELVRV